MCHVPAEDPDAKCCPLRGFLPLPCSCPVLLPISLGNTPHSSLAHHLCLRFCFRGSSPGLSPNHTEPGRWGWPRSHEESHGHTGGCLASARNAYYTANAWACPRPGQAGTSQWLGGGVEASACPVRGSSGGEASTGQVGGPGRGPSRASGQGRSGWGHVCEGRCHEDCSCPEHVRQATYQGHVGQKEVRTPKSRRQYGRAPRAGPAWPSDVGHGRLERPGRQTRTGAPAMRGGLVGWGAFPLPGWFRASCLCRRPADA